MVRPAAGRGASAGWPARAGARPGGPRLVQTRLLLLPQSGSVDASPETTPIGAASGSGAAALGSQNRVSRRLGRRRLEFIDCGLRDLRPFACGARTPVRSRAGSTLGVRATRARRRNLASLYDGCVAVDRRKVPRRRGGHPRAGCPRHRCRQRTGAAGRPGPSPPGAGGGRSAAPATIRATARAARSSSSSAGHSSSAARVRWTQPRSPVACVAR